MVAKNRAHEQVNKYREVLNKKLAGADGRNLKPIVSKNKVLDFFLNNLRWPSRLSTNKNERALATKFENYVSKASQGYDPRLRKLVMANGRTTNNKRGHDIAGRKLDILAFIRDNGHAPSASSLVLEERNLRNKLNRYTLELKDMSFLGDVYSLDPCHRSGIPTKYRSLINESLDIDKPLIRLV